MTKILHTADVHLREYGDERWKALEKVVETGRRERVDLLAISGDLFERDADAEKLRDRIREVFSGTGFRVLILPGNHDSASYTGGLYFGEDVVILGEPFSCLELEGLVIWGLPFAPLNKEEVIGRLQELSRRITSRGMDSHQVNVLLYHGELLDAFFSRKDMGDEGNYSYMPAALSSFAEAGLDYVLAGHFHTDFRVWPFPGRNSGSFIYPGSPVSVTSREKGRRKVNLLDLGSQAPPREIHLDTFHYEEVLIELDPFSESDPLPPIEERLKELHPSSLTTLRVTGYFNGAALGTTEQELAERLHNLDVGRDRERGRGWNRSRGWGQIQLQAQFKDIRHILEDPLTRSFLEKLEWVEASEETRKSIRDLTLRAMMEVRP